MLFGINAKFFFEHCQGFFSAVDVLGSDSVAE